MRFVVAQRVEQKLKTFRYWTEDINSLNDHFGSADDLKSLVTALHDRKMYLMLDVVVNQ